MHNDSSFITPSWIFHHAVLIALLLCSYVYCLWGKKKEIKRSDTCNINGIVLIDISHSVIFILSKGNDVHTTLL